MQTEEFMNFEPYRVDPNVNLIQAVRKLQQFMQQITFHFEDIYSMFGSTDKQVQILYKETKYLKQNVAAIEKQRQQDQTNYCQLNSKIKISLTTQINSIKKSLIQLPTLANEVKYIKLREQKIQEQLKQTAKKNAKLISDFKNQFSQQTAKNAKLIFELKNQFSQHYNKIQQNERKLLKNLSERENSNIVTLSQRLIKIQTNLNNKQQLFTYTKKLETLIDKHYEKKLKNQITKIVDSYAKKLFEQKTELDFMEEKSAAEKRTQKPQI